MSFISAKISEELKTLANDFTEESFKNGDIPSLLQHHGVNILFYDFIRVHTKSEINEFDTKDFKLMDITDKWVVLEYENITTKKNKQDGGAYSIPISEIRFINWMRDIEE